MVIYNHVVDLYCDSGQPHGSSEDQHGRFVASSWTGCKMTAEAIGWRFYTDPNGARLCVCPECNKPKDMGLKPLRTGGAYANKA